MPRFLRFVDGQGGRWRAYEFSIMAGRVIYVRPGERSAQYRGFIPDPADGRLRRRCMLFTPDDHVVDVATLQRQLERAVLDPRDDPTHPIYGQRRQ